jgi:hypothetical protein
MTTQTKKTVTVKFTATEVDWLLNKLERIATDARDKAKNSGSHSLLEEQFKAESLMDRIRSEQ